MAVVETNGNNAPQNPSGVYRHPDTNQELIFQETGKFGNPGADAAVRLGFVYVGPAKLEERDADGPKGDVVAALDPSAGPQANTDPIANQARLEVELAEAKRRLAAAEKASNAKSDLVEKGDSK
jgi:hypothetical protein